MKLSLCITTYNRYELTIESFAKVLDDDRIDDIVIMDDGSSAFTVKRFAAYIRSINDFKLRDKIKFFTREQNQGMSLNKRDAISNAKNEWCIIFDSDNVIDPTYLDAFCDYVGDEPPISNRTIFCPDFAQPKFDYRKYSDPNLPCFNRNNIANYVINDDFNCLMNTCNYIVNRDFYLEVYKHNAEHVASDTIWHNYNHLQAGGNFHVVPGMQYYHRVHAGSGFMQNADYNIKQADKVRKLIQQL